METPKGRDLAAELKSAGYTANQIACGLMLVGVDEEWVKTLLT